MRTVAEKLKSVLPVAGTEWNHGERGDSLDILADSLRRRAIQYRLAAALAEIPRDRSMFTDLASMFHRLACHFDEHQAALAQVSDASRRGRNPLAFSDMLFGVPQT